MVRFEERADRQTIRVNFCSSIFRVCFSVMIAPAHARGAAGREGACQHQRFGVPRGGRSVGRRLTQAGTPSGQQASSLWLTFEEETNRLAGQFLSP